MVENFAQIWIKKNSDGEWGGTFNDQTCTKPVPVACEVVWWVVFRLRGSRIRYKDILRSLPKHYYRHNIYNGKWRYEQERFFSGNFGWKILWDTTTQVRLKPL